MTMHWSLDTESGATRRGSYRLKDGTVYECGEDLKNRVVTYAPLGVRDLDDVRCIVSEPDEDVYDLLYDKLVGSEPEGMFVFHVWNLDWEVKPLVAWFHRHCDRNGFTFNDPNPLNAGNMGLVVTVNGWYQLVLRCKDVILTFVDDNNHYHTSVKKATESLMKHVHWKSIMDNNGLGGKESGKVEGLHEIWYTYDQDSVEYRTYVHYAKVDAFCQALLMESLFDNGRFCTPKCFDGEDMHMRYSPKTALSASGAGFRDAKSILMYGCRYRDIPVKMKDRIEDFARRKRKTFDECCSMFMGRLLDMRWTDKFGLLREREQRMVENNLRGGFVYGEVGVWKGRFWHYDYKSSYPFEYAFCKLPVGGWTETDGDVRKRRCVEVCTDVREMERWLTDYDDDSHQLYVVGSVRFKLKDGALPLITAKECVDDDGLALRNYGGARSKKMLEGRTKSLLWTLEEWKLLDRLYELEGEIHEVWCCKAEWRFFKPAIELYFNGKENSEGVEKSMHKLDLNGATHGRAMIRVLTAPKIRMGDEWLVNVSVRDGDWAGEGDIQTNPLVGMTAMAHARVRLLDHCMTLKENGWQVLVCDTDSLVTDCPPEECDRLLGMSGWKDWVMHKDERTGMDETLGRLEIEQDRLGAEMFDELRCWGLKRYAEFCDGVMRKSAFAGMHKEDQEELLGGEWKEKLAWHSTSKKWMGDCYAVRYHCVDAGVENIWYEVEA